MDITILDAYFAGLFDGEGSIGIYKVSNGKGSNEKKFFSIKLSIVGTHRPMIQKAYEHFGIGHFSTQKRQALHSTPKGNYRLEDATDDIKICKQSWRWTLTSKKEVEMVLKRLAPFLNEKKEQAEICLNFLAGQLDANTASSACKEAKKFIFPSGDFVQPKRRSGGLKGATNPCSKLTDADANSIRTDVAEGISIKTLAVKWGVDRCTIYRILKNESYSTNTGQ